ncbi:MAG TPA: S41 family peptidase, partial [Puia sp.]|nr:S41 family peptidase [Puia sp.]
MKRRSFLIGVVFPFFLISCHKDLPDAVNAQDYPGDSYPELFEAFWTGMNTNYIFWSIDTTNWDAVYTRYKPLFAQLTSFNSGNEAKAEQYFTEMTSGLIDGHYNLTFEATGRSFSPSLSRKLTADANFLQDSAYPATSLNTLIGLVYIDSGSLRMGSDPVTLGTSHTSLTAISGTIGGSILYLYFSNFSISQAATYTTPVFNYFFSTLRSLSGIKGVILDLRGNPGGEVSDLDYIVGQMVNEPYTFGYTRTKGGANRLDYTPWAPAIVKPWNGGTKVTAPIVVLADHLSTSMAEITTMAVKTLPNGKFIGTRTWGATGP